MALCLQERAEVLSERRPPTKCRKQGGREVLSDEEAFGGDVGTHTADPGSPEAHRATFRKIDNRLNRLI
jgi:hypothetical protein